MNRRHLLLVLALALASPGAAYAKVKVVATLPSLAAIAKVVAGDDADVSALVSPDQDPHYVDPRPSLVLELARADLLIINGLDLESSWLDPLVTQSRNPKLQPGSAGRFDASVAVERLEVPLAKPDRAHGDVHPGGNPHYLFDARAGARVALGLGKRLGEIDPAHAAAYSDRSARYASALEKLAAQQRARFETLPAGKRRVVSYHQSLSYLYDWLRIEQVITVEPKPGVPPHPGHVAKVLKTMKGDKLGVVVQEAFYPKNTSRTLTKLTKGELVVLPGGTRFKDGQTFEAHLLEISEALHAALSR
jgi:zinc/manganese transport system substrate-binding protein